ncbi:MAG: DUF2723 domain-containing protein [Bacteroidales bacterium]|nr:DUF2723 domain-containing protein [Bacteroidales bacterium]
MRGHLQQGRRQLVAPLLSLFATTLYLLTLDRSASWWDCGEFIAVSHLLQVGHPPGAPLYQLLAHLCSLLAFGNPLLVAPLCNALSALCGGLTVGLLYLTATELGASRRGALIGALCYLFCDTAWFSAVESEVYALAMLFCSLDLWLTLRYRRTRNPRLLPLLTLLLGLGLCVHLMTLLILPAILLILGREAASHHATPRLLRLAPMLALFFLLGTTPYLIIPIRAAAHPPINEGNPATAHDFAAYLHRDQYTKAPLYPRLWRERDSLNTRYWTGGHSGLLGNARYFITYQAGYMYARYLMYNFIGRENLAYNPNAKQVPILNSQFSIFILPFLLGLYGLLLHRRHRRADYWVVMLLFLFGGILLGIYLNHPCYEPRERDYAYILSFYAFALWIGIGASRLMATAQRWRATRRLASTALFLLTLAAPLTLAAGNFGDHNRSRCHSVHDIALNHLQSCDHGALLLTLGDNDTFPLWYLQQVEHRRPDITILNINLEGYLPTLQAASLALASRPVYVSHYFHERYPTFLSLPQRCEGYCWRLLPPDEDPTSLLPLQRHVADSIRWHITPGEYLDPVSRSFLRIWEENTTLPPKAL